LRVSDGSLLKFLITTNRILSCSETKKEFHN